jgi:hypothetical protein
MTILPWLLLISLGQFWADSWWPNGKTNRQAINNFIMCITKKFIV